MGFAHGRQSRMAARGIDEESATKRSDAVSCDEPRFVLARNRAATVDRCRASLDGELAQERIERPAIDQRDRAIRRAFLFAVRPKNARAAREQKLRDARPRRWISMAKQFERTGRKRLPSRIRGQVAARAMKQSDTMTDLR